MFERILYIITYWLFAIMVWMAATPVKADSVLVIHRNYGGAHTNVGALYGQRILAYRFT